MAGRKDAKGNNSEVTITSTVGGKVVGNHTKINRKEQACKRDLLYLMDSIVQSQEFWTVNYYLRSMKKAPHGDVVTVSYPNIFLKYYSFQPRTLICHVPEEIPIFMQEIVEYALTVFYECDSVDYEELLQYCFAEDNWYLGFRLLHVKPEYEETNAQQHGLLLRSILGSRKRITDYFDIEPKYALYALILVLVAEKAVHICNVEEIERHEKLRDPHNKYGLSALSDSDVKFLRQGFQVGDIYYLYNIFLDPTIASTSDGMPYTFRIISNEIAEKTLFMRCDENLAVPAEKMLSTATYDLQKFHGITISFANIESILSKEIVVHIHPALAHKLVMVIKPDKEFGNTFYHIEIEQLWAPDTISDEFVMATFVHAKYFPHKHAFTHMDFSINQYEKDIYIAKYTEAVNNTGVPVDKYGDIHYKIWCVEADTIKVETWSKLVSVTLDAPFREIFTEMFTA
ncbi:hypothetical protein [Dysosmobacter sp.]|uniref:hypothetical protein n=1 Tax=Dysosmobacter sp. TaxID=2591382 RepID=UPI003AF724D4